MLRKWFHIKVRKKRRGEVGERDRESWSRRGSEWRSGIGGALDSPGEQLGRSWGGRWGPSSAGTRGTRPEVGCTCSPRSWAFRTRPRCLLPLEWSCSDSGTCGNLHSRSHTHSGGLESACPHRKWSEAWGEQRQELGSWAALFMIK